MTKEDLNEDTPTEKEVKELKELTTIIFYDGYTRGLEDFAKALNMAAARIGKNNLPVDLIVNELIPAHVKCVCKKRDEILKEVDNEGQCLTVNNVILN